MNITEDYVSFEVAKLLKEKGFDCKTEHRVWYVIKQFSTGCHWNVCTYKVGDITREYNDDCCIPMPTHQMARRWLREIHKVNIEIHYNRFGENYKYLIIYKPEVLDDIRSLGVYFHYEDAVEAALKYCLKNLI